MPYKTYAGWEILGTDVHTFKIATVGKHCVGEEQAELGAELSTSSF